MTNAQELKNQSELEDSLSKELQDLQEHKENIQSWIRDQQIKVKLLGEDTQMQERITGAQVSYIVEYLIKCTSKKQSSCNVLMFVYFRP